MKSEIKVKRMTYKIGELTNQLDELAEQEEGKYTEDDCPLVVSEWGHYTTSEFLWGLDCYGWTCKFCGTKFWE